MWDPSGHDGDVISALGAAGIGGMIESGNALATAVLGAEEGGAAAEGFVYYDEYIESEIFADTVESTGNGGLLSDAGEATGEAPGQLARDANVNPEPPGALETEGRAIGPNQYQNETVQQDIAEARAQGAEDVRLNQQQINGTNTRVGINRPDLQYTLNGQRYYTEYDISEASAETHYDRILANDPAAKVTLKIFTPDGSWYVYVPNY